MNTAEPPPSGKCQHGTLRVYCRLCSACAPFKAWNETKGKDTRTHARRARLFYCLSLTSYYVKEIGLGNGKLARFIYLDTCLLVCGAMSNFRCEESMADNVCLLFNKPMGIGEKGKKRCTRARHAHTHTHTHIHL